MFVCEKLLISHDAFKDLHWITDRGSSKSYSAASFYKSLTHSWSRALLEKPPIVQLLENFPAFYGTRRFITAFT
jgi:hypothetical protein